MYLYAGAADVYAETGDLAIFDALKKIWSSAVERKMYVTGAVGQVHHGARDRTNMIHEGFIDDYLLPNSTAYNETCANIALAMFNWRMLAIEGEAKYADIMELVLYNSALVGISTCGKKYFYANPLRFNRGQREYSDHCDCTESADREPYIECFCCPPNLVRTIAKVSGWAYSLTEGGVAVNLYGGNRLDTTLADGSELKLKQETQYPWNGRVKLTIEACKDQAFDVRLRIPGWATGAKVTVNGEGISSVAAGTYVQVDRQWQAGDEIDIDMPMPVRFVEGHPRIEEIRNQVAIKRGPLVYCIESPDLPEGTGILDVYISEKVDLQVEHRPDFLGGVSMIKGEVLLRPNQGQGLYRELSSADWEKHQTQFVPYFAWSNRGTAEMTVFVPIVWKGE
jgi:DUF1680 family protein